MKSIEEIQQIVAGKHNITVEQMKSKIKQQPLVDCRQISMYLCLEAGHKKKKTITEAHNKCSAVIHHSIRCIMNKIELDPEFRIELRDLKKLCEIPDDRNEIKASIINDLKRFAKHLSSANVSHAKGSIYQICENIDMLL